MVKYDFIVNDFGTTMPTPERCAAGAEFLEDSLGLEEWEYDQFLRMRKDIGRIFSDPFHTTIFQDDIGRGYVASIMDRQVPSPLVWSMLEQFIKGHGWLKLVHSSGGFVKTKVTNKDMLMEMSHKEVYKVKLYLSLTQEIEYCPEYGHHYLPAAQREMVEALVGTTGYCDEYDRCIVNDKQVTILKGCGYVSV
jgi:hypothetical protein